MKLVAVLLTGLAAVFVSARPVPLSPSDILGGGWEIEISIQTQNSTRPFAEDCQEFCSYTYPEHTYPEPADFKACATGCRTAQLDAFIAWPVEANPEKCEEACHEMYSVEDQRYACITGCKTPTIDSTFPNRSHLYREGNLTSEVDLLLSPREKTWSYFLDSFFLPQSPFVFDDLAEHAQSMEMLVVPYLRSDVTVLTNDGVYTYREYSIDNGGSNNADMSSSHPVYKDPWLNQYQHKHSSCVWLLHRTVLNRLLMVLSVGLVIAALATCCLSSCSPEGGKRVPKISSIKSSPPLSTKKAPYDLGSEFILRDKVHVGTFGQVNHKITLL